MNFKMCGGLFSFCFLHEAVFGNGQIAITHNIESTNVKTKNKHLNKHEKKTKNK